jgi:hypothetical protein
MMPLAIGRFEAVQLPVPRDIDFGARGPIVPNSG